jgi:hypothetical protein
VTFVKAVINVKIRTEIWLLKLQSSTFKKLQILHENNWTMVHAMTYGVQSAPNC